VVPKVNKLALVRMTLHRTFNEMDTRELLCVLADMYAGAVDKDSQAPRWYGNGSGTQGLEQGIYNHMTTFRRVTNLWSKMKLLSPDIKQETYGLRDYIVKMLSERGVDLKEIEEHE
jgi:hypothetical protein